MGGAYGPVLLCRNAWTEGQVHQWHADPWGFLRPAYHPIPNAIGACPDGRFSSELAADGEFGAELASDGKLSSELAADGAFSSGLAADGKFSSELAADGNFSSCRRE